MQKIDQPSASEPLPHRKISETFLDYAAPVLVHMPAEAQAADVEHVLRIPYVVWNAIVFDKVQGGDGHLALVRTRMSGTAHGAALIEQLVERKRTLFADDDRLVGEYWVTLKQGEMNLWAEVRDPYSKLPANGQQNGGTNKQREEDPMKKTVSLLSAVALAAGLASAEPGKPVALLDQVPYRDEGMGSRKVVDEKHVLMMQVALKPGQKVPEHKANSNVHILVLKGAVVVNLAGTDVAIKEGDLLPIALATQMHIRNDSQDNATFLIVKTPNPSGVAAQK